MKELIDTYFNVTYDKMYSKVIAFVVARCSDINYVEDIVQDIFTEFYSLLCRKGLTYIKDEEAMIMRISKTKVYKYYSLKQKLKRFIPLTNKREEEEERDNSEIVYEDVEEKYINQYTLNEIWQIISSTPADVQKIFVLYFYADKKIKDIAEELHMTQSNVKHKLYRTLEKIRELYNKEERDKI